MAPGGLTGFLQESRRLYFTPKRRRHRGKEVPDAADPPTPAKTLQRLELLDDEVSQKHTASHSPSRSVPSPIKVSPKLSPSKVLKPLLKRPKEAKPDKAASVAKMAFKNVPSQKLVVGLPFEWASRLMGPEKPKRLLSSTKATAEQMDQ